MKREKHELYPLVSRVIIQIVNNTDEKTREEKPWILLATHVDKQFEELLKDISLDEAPEIE